jgi:hypothetical protein
MTTSDLNNLPAMQALNTKGFVVHFKDDAGKYVSQTSLYVGKIRIASFYYSAFVARGSQEKYKVVTPIESLMRQDYGMHNTSTQAADVCIEIAHLFFDALNYK